MGLPVFILEKFPPHPSPPSHPSACAHIHTHAHAMSFPVNYSNMLTVLAHTSGRKQVWIGDDGKASPVVVYGCPSSQTKRICRNSWLWALNNHWPLSSRPGTGAHSHLCHKAPDFLEKVCNKPSIICPLSWLPGNASVRAMKGSCALCTLCDLQ